LIRLWVRPDGSFAETVYADESPAAVEAVNAVLAAKYPDATPEDYSNDAYEAMRPKDGSDLTRWRRRGTRIVVEPAPVSDRDAARQALDQATTVADLKAALRRLL